MDHELHSEVDVEKTALWSVGEEQEKYTLILGQAIEQYLEDLRSLERQIAGGQMSEDAILGEIVSRTDAILKICAQYEQEVKDEAAVKATRSYFRKRTHPILSKSYAVNRIRTWPQGYQGDHLTLEAAYRNAPMSDGIGYYLDKYLQDWPLAHALRGRIAQLTHLIREELTNRKNPRVLDIACGSCREIVNLIPDIKSSGASVMCVDLDEDALAFSENRLSFADVTPGSVSFRKFNALRLFDLDIAKAEFGKQDIIYSVGYFDYLPDDFLVKLLRSLYQMLNQGGKLIAAFKDAERYRSQEYHWIADWDGFLQRTPAQFERLLGEAGIPPQAMSVSRDRSGIIIFYTSTKA